MTDSKASKDAGLNGFCGIWRNGQEECLFSNTESGKNLPQQIIGRHDSNNVLKMTMSKPQGFRDQFPGITLVCQHLRFEQSFARQVKSVQMARSGAERGNRRVKVR